MPTPTKGPRLGGGPAHERLMLANLATALFEHGRITTTEAKAKRLRPLAERLITKAKRGDLHARRQVLAVIRDKTRRARRCSPRSGRATRTRPGGYTRITKVGPRKGDNAPDGRHRAGRGADGAAGAVGEAEAATEAHGQEDRRRRRLPPRRPAADTTDEAATEADGRRRRGDGRGCRGPTDEVAEDADERRHAPSRSRPRSTRRRPKAPTTWREAPAEAAVSDAARRGRRGSRRRRGRRGDEAEEPSDEGRRRRLTRWPTHRRRTSPPPRPGTAGSSASGSTSPTTAPTSPAGRAQPGLRTVQGRPSRTRSRVVLRLPSPARLTVAGRTDAGVHARGQVAHVDVPRPLWERRGRPPLRALAGRAAPRRRACGRRARPGRLRRAVLRAVAPLRLPDLRRSPPAPTRCAGTRCSGTAAAARRRAR